MGERIVRIPVQGLLEQRPGSRIVVFAVTSQAQQPSLQQFVACEVGGRLRLPTAPAPRRRAGSPDWLTIFRAISCCRSKMPSPVAANASLQSTLPLALSMRPNFCFERGGAKPDPAAHEVSRRRAAGRSPASLRSPSEANPKLELWARTVTVRKRASPFMTSSAKPSTSGSFDALAFVGEAQDSNNRLRLGRQRQSLASRKQVAAPGDGANGLLVVVGERFAQLTDGLGQRVLGDKDAGPDRRDEVGLADHPAAIAGQVVEQCECFRAARNRFVTAQQQAA